VAGDEAAVLDKEDATASIDVSFGRAGGKRTTVVNAVIRAFRTDVKAERPTTLAVRATLVDGAVSPATAKDLDAYFMTWPGPGAIAPHAYATVTKSALTYVVSDTAIEVRGSLSLKDLATGKTVRIEKFVLRRVGTGLLPPRSGVWITP